MKIFPIITEILPAAENFDCRLLVDSISNWAKSNSLSISINQISKDSVSFSVNNTSYIFHNSFLPVVDIDLKQSNNQWQLLIQFSLQKNVRIFAFVYMCIAVILQSILLFACIMGECVFSVGILVPAALLVFAVLLSYVGLKISARHMMKIINQFEKG